MLVPGPAASVTRWLRRGVVAVRVADLGRWAAVCLADSRARSAAPYDVGLEVLAAAPAPFSRRPALGFFAMKGRAVVTVQVRSWRSTHLWLVWEPGVGQRQTPDLTELPLTVLVRAAGAARSTTLEALRSHLARTTGTPLEFLLTLLAMLDLPGGDLLRHGAPEDLPAIEPSLRAIRAFDSLVAESAERHGEPAATAAGESA